MSLTVTTGLMPNVSTYLGTEPRDTGLALSFEVARRWVPEMTEDEIFDAYDMAAQWFAAMDDHPENFGGERLVAMQRLWSVCYPSVDWDDPSVALFGIAGLLESPIAFASEVFRDATMGRIDWTLPPDARSPAVDEWLAILLRGFSAN